MSTVLKIKIKSVYGNEMIYPANDVAEKFCNLLGKKTLSDRDLGVIIQLGFKVEQVNAYQLGGLGEAK